MGPNKKSRPRKQYVNYRLRVLRELCVMPPTKEQIAWAMDPSRSTEIEVDNMFLTIMKKSFGRKS